MKHILIKYSFLLLPAAFMCCGCVFGVVPNRDDPWTPGEERPFARFHAVSMTVTDIPADSELKPLAQVTERWCEGRVILTAAVAGS